MINCGSSSPSILVRFLAVALLCASPPVTMTLGERCGGIREVQGFENDAEIEQLARFAVDEHNKKNNGAVEFGRVVKAKEQVVSGTMHYLTVEAIEEGKKKLYEAKVWVQHWRNFKELQHFKPLSDSVDSQSSSSTSIPTADRDGQESGWRTVPAHDPVVKDAADHAVKTIQQRSNSLAAYELLEILHAKAEVIEELAKFDLLIKVKRGSKEEKFKVEVHKNVEGNFHLNQMQEEL